MLQLHNDRVVPFRIVGNPDLKSEDAMSYEIGFRRQATEKFYWDISVYFNRYDNMIDVAPPVFIPPYETYIFQNLGAGDTYGFEWTGNYQVNDKWKLTGNYSLFRLTQTGMGAIGYQYDFPRNMANLRSGWDIGKNIYFDIGLRYIDSAHGHRRTGLFPRRCARGVASQQTLRSRNRRTGLVWRSPPGIHGPRPKSAHRITAGLVRNGQLPALMRRCHCWLTRGSATIVPTVERSMEALPRLFGSAAE